MAVAWCRRRELRGGQQGAISALALFMIALIVITVLTITLSGANTALDDSLKQQQRNAALFLAESGLEYALQQLDSNTVACDSTLASTVTLGTDSFSIAAGKTTAFDGVTVLPVNRCRVSVAASLAAGAVRNVEAVVEYGGGGGIALDSVSSRGGNNRSSLDWTHTFTGSNGLLIVGVAYRNDTTVSSVSYAGVAMTQLSSIDTGPDVRVEQWYLVAPTPGANTIVVTLAAQSRLMAGGVSLTGVDQLSPVATTATSANSAASTPQVNIAVTTNGAWVLDNIGIRGQVSVPVPDIAQVLHWADATNGGNAGNPKVLAGGSSKGPLGPGSYSMQWSASTVPWALSAVVVKPASAGSDGVVAWRELVLP